MKEALAAKGRHLRRSLSTPNVQHVMNTSLTPLINEAHKSLFHYEIIQLVSVLTCCFLALQSSCSRTDLMGCEDEDCKVCLNNL